MTTWTRKDQEQFNNLLERKKAFDSVKRNEFKKLIQTWPFTSYGKDDYDQMYEWFVNNADAINDFVSQFDSGVRAQ